MTFPVTSKPTPPTVFNLQALDWIHCEEETGAHTGISRLTSEWVHFFYKFFNVYLNIKTQLSSIWAKGCILMTVCVFYLT